MKRAGWHWYEVTSRPVTVHEPTPVPTPLLYAPDGKPLAPAEPRVGFRMPERKEGTR